MDIFFLAIVQYSPKHPSIGGAAFDLYLSIELISMYIYTCWGKLHQSCTADGKPSESIAARDMSMGRTQRRGELRRGRRH